MYPSGDFLSVAGAQEMSELNLAFAFARVFATVEKFVIMSGTEARRAAAELGEENRTHQAK